MIGFVSGGSPDSWATVRKRSADLERGRLVEGRLGVVQALNSMTDDAVRFGQFRFDLRRRELFRDESSVRLGGRALDVLHALAAAKGDVVSKTELLARVWPGMAVGENNLQVQISLLRKTLQEDAGGESYLVTVPSRGYRLVGPSMLAQGPALPDKPSIAVLPFENMSDDPGQDYFADGIVEDIITALCRIRWLFVIARNSSFSYKNRGRYKTGGSGAGRSLCARRRRAQGRTARAHHGSAGRCRQWHASLGRSF